MNELLRNAMAEPSAVTMPEAEESTIIAGLESITDGFDNTDLILEYQANIEALILAQDTLENLEGLEAELSDKDLGSMDSELLAAYAKTQDAYMQSFGGAGEYSLVTAGNEGLKDGIKRIIQVIDNVIKKLMSLYKTITKSYDRAITKINDGIGNLATYFLYAESTGISNNTVDFDYWKYTNAKDFNELHTNVKASKEYLDDVRTARVIFAGSAAKEAMQVITSKYEFTEEVMKKTTKTIIDDMSLLVPGSKLSDDGASEVSKLKLMTGFRPEFLPINLEGEITLRKVKLNMNLDNPKLKESGELSVKEIKELSEMMSALLINIKAMIGLQGDVTDTMKALKSATKTTLASREEPLLGKWVSTELIQCGVNVSHFLDKIISTHLKSIGKFVAEANGRLAVLDKRVAGK